MNATEVAIEHYCAALQASQYKVQLKNRLTGEGFWVEYSPDQLRRAVNYLRGKNANGFDVYARPVGWQYVLLDDLQRDVLLALSAMQPCMLLETSPQNFQAWLILAETPPDREKAKEICKILATQFGADLASAEPDHVGRLPGFTNQKERHQLPSGQYPFVKLRRWEHRYSSFYLRGGAVLKADQKEHPLAPINSAYLSGKNSLSEHDFGVACALLRAGRPYEQVYHHLLNTSANLAERKGRHIERYLSRTINNAVRALRL